MGGSSIQNATTIVTEAFTGKIRRYGYEALQCTTPSTVTITGTDVKIEDIKQIKYTIDTVPVYIETRPTDEAWEKVTVEKNKIVLKRRVGYLYKLSRVLQAETETIITIKGATENVSQGTVAEAYTSSFPLTEIDDLREYILSKGREEILINKDSDEKLKSLFIYNVLFSPNPEKDGTPESIPLS